MTDRASDYSTEVGLSANLSRGPPSETRGHVGSLSGRVHTDTVYNLTVEGFHTFFVGETGVLVHNTSPCDGAGTAAHNSEKAAGEGANVAESWKLGAFKSAVKWENQLAKRSWTLQQITEAIAKGEKFAAENLVNKGNAATRFVHPTTGRSVVQDQVTKEIIHVGGDGFKY